LLRQLRPPGLIGKGDPRQKPPPDHQEGENLGIPEEDILKRMKGKWRYNIGLAEKRGVRVLCCGSQLTPSSPPESGEEGMELEKGLELFYQILQETTGRDGIAIHGLDYYRSLFAQSREYPGSRTDIRLYLAFHGGDLLAAVVILFRDGMGVYLYGASSDRKRNLMAPYALQWRAMRDARAAGCTVYDLFGIPPDGDPNHPMAGLYRFKTGFVGRIIHRPGSWDYPYRPLLTFLFKTAEGLRKSFRNLKKRRPR
jgi:lipid II:glycine glycyltransferase (peptidoglycan interpeptide bridge formation enzyme)